MKVTLDQSPEAGQITCDAGMAAPRFPISLIGVLRIEGDTAVLTLASDYHVKPGHTVSRNVRDRGRNPNWPEAEPGAVPGSRP